MLEALARIAGARGETALAVGFLEGLVASASGAAAARYHRRIAEAHRHGGDTEAAVESLMRALEQFAEDSDSLQMLEDIHRGGENWRALVGVLARRATIETGDDQTSCYRAIAQVWEEQIGDARVAIDAWRKVLELEPADAVALEQLVTLTRSEEDWASFGQTGAGRPSCRRVRGVRERQRARGHP